MNIIMQCVTHQHVHTSVWDPKHSTLSRVVKCARKSDSRWPVCDTFPWISLPKMTSGFSRSTLKLMANPAISIGITLQMCGGQVRWYNNWHNPYFQIQFLVCMHNWWTTSIWMKKAGLDVMQSHLQLCWTHLACMCTKPPIWYQLSRKLRYCKLRMSMALGMLVWAW